MPEKDSKDSFYYLNAYQDGITPGQKMTIQHNISFNDWRAGPHIAPLVTLTSAGSHTAPRRPALRWKRNCTPS